MKRKIKSREELAAFLEDKPIAWSHVIAMRSALRVLPILAKSFEGKLDKNIRDRLLTTTLRACFSSWAFCIGQGIDSPNSDYTVDAYSFTVDAYAYIPDAAAATDAAYSAASAVATNNVTRAAAYAGYACARAAAASLAVGDENSTDIWGEISNDIVLLQKLPILTGFGGPQDFSKYQPDADELAAKSLWDKTAPDWSKEYFDKLVLALNDDDPANDIWKGWFQERINGGVRFSASISEDHSIAIRISSQNNEFWKQELATISLQITQWAFGASDDWLPNTQAENSDLSPQTITETELISDAANSHIDYLDRAPIAFALAGRINQIWDDLNKPESDGDGEVPGFVVHVDAPWGGGKTTFAGYLTRILNPYAANEPLPEWLKKLHMDDEKYWPLEHRRPWHIVHFNAWQHQHNSPPWWVFYDTMLKTILGSVLHEKNHMAAIDQKLNLSETVPGSPANPYVYFSNPLIRVGRYLCERIIEIVWRLFTPKFVWRLITTIAVMLMLFVFVKLDWISFDLSKNSINSQSSSTAISTIMVVLFGGGTALWTLVSTFTSSLLPGTPKAVDNYSLGSGDPLARFRKYFAWRMKLFRRPVLVVIDDIDRCEPKFVVDLVRGMQTILQSSRVVYLILGDRDWVEKSFSCIHKEMKDIDVGPEHEFGARFVEKAIQFSFVLPEITDEQRKSYVRAVLADEDKAIVKPEDKALEVETEKFNKKITEFMKEPSSKVRNKTVRKHLADLKASPEISAQVYKQREHQANIELILRSAADEDEIKETKHLLESISEILPANPRQIKRIINTISLTESVALLTNKVEKGDEKWREMALWIVLMIEWPKTWFTLSKDAGMIERVQNKNFSKDKLAVEIRENEAVMNILDFTQGDINWPDTKIDVDAVKWLVEILPPTSGKLLDPPTDDV